MKIAVYTCITNNYEPLQKQQNFNGADWFIFSDTEVDDDHWIYLPAVKLFQDPRRNARYHKMLPHLYFGEYDYWVETPPWGVVEDAVTDVNGSAMLQVPPMPEGVTATRYTYLMGGATPHIAFPEVSYWNIAGNASGITTVSQIPV